MTSEQVANLKGRLDERCVDGEGINVTREDVEKLLDEREALLEALKKATDAIAAEWGESSAQELRAAIAKAEP